MEGFKTLPKMQHFKTGGSVKDMCYGGKAMKKGGHAESEEMSSDLAQDKKLIKKAFKQHDKAEHGGKDGSEIKLRKGGRAKKELGTARKFIKSADAPSGAKGGPNKYKCGGGVYGAKKTDADIESIDSAKKCKPKKLSTGGTCS